MNSRCSSSRSSYSGHCNLVGPCSCGLFHTQTPNSNSLSMLFSSFDDYNNQGDFCPFTSSPPSNSSSSSSVDCTLSLGTPSTRLSNDNEITQSSSDQRHPSSYNFSWDILRSKKSVHKSSRGTDGAAAYNSDDPFLSRRCANCDTTSTPLWRNGPRGPKSLCNACGIRFKKEERRASAAAAAMNGVSGDAGGMMMGLPTYY